MKINAGEIRVGMLLEYKNDLWQVLKTQHVKPGKGGAFAQVEMKSVNKNTKLNERFRSNETIEKASLEETNFTFSYEDQEKYFFMNPKTFEQTEIQKSLIGEKGKLLTENLEVTISFYNDNPISVDLPNQVTCKIEATDAALKGQTVSSSYKPAILENGLKQCCTPGTCGSQPLDVNALRMLAQIYLEDRQHQPRALELLSDIQRLSPTPTWEDQYLSALAARNDGHPFSHNLSEQLLSNLSPSDPRRNLVLSAFPA